MTGASTSTTTSWAEVVVPVGAADLDEVAALIVSEVLAAAAGTEQRGSDVVFWVAADAAPAALAEVQDAARRWQAGGLAVDPARVRIADAVPEAEWRDAWKRYFRVSRLTRQLVVVPSWERYTPAPDDVVIHLDPGMAFGTGTHASTRLVLEELQAIADRRQPSAGGGDPDGSAGGAGVFPRGIDRGRPPARVLDAGCGSGILAIAAAKHWPGASCVALDVDPIAVAATAENAAANGVADRIDARVAAETGALAALGEAFPLVVANIQADVLRALQRELIACTAPGGTLILSGLLTPQAQPLADELVAAGLRLVHVRASADDPAWSCVTLVR
ncbi:MAG: methyltransferase domain-containing protein [Deltaproteobacteria bacterium]|nr:MAG: methyltransferase domain-containing protein [Deltaproteobacteria bacterium]